MDKVKAFSVRMDKKLWEFVKKKSIELEKPMNYIINFSIEEYKKNCKKKLTKDDTMV